MENKDIWDRAAMAYAAPAALEHGTAAQPDEATGGGQSLTSHECPSGYSRYAWRTTDTLEDVARRYGLRAEAIRDANPGIVFTRLNFGDEICIPCNMGYCPTGRFYTIRRGDTFASVAAKLGVPAYELTRLNPYADPATLQPGQPICVPAVRPAKLVMPPAVPPSGEGVPDCASDNIMIIFPENWDYGTLLRKYGISYNALMAANPDLDADAIPVGKKICIPPPGSRRLCAAGTRSHIIERGETLESLARRFNTSAAHMLRLNAMLAPSDFIAGRVICAPE